MTRRAFVDVPVEVQRRLRQSLHQLTGLGRRWEVAEATERLISDLSYRRETIIALGVDSLSRYQNYEELAVFSYLVFLDPPFETLWNRVSANETHAALRTRLGRDGLQASWQERRLEYERCHLRLNTDALDPELTARLVLHCFYT